MFSYENRKLIKSTIDREFNSDASILRREMIKQALNPAIVKQRKQMIETGLRNARSMMDYK